MTNLDHVVVDLEKDLTAEPVDQKIEESVDKATGHTAISIRMSHDMIDSLKAIAKVNKGMGYQTLIKQVLQRFIDCEKRNQWNKFVHESLEQENPDTIQEAREEDTKRAA